MIIIEGLDNTGKSFLVKRLSKDMGLLAMNNQRRPQASRDISDYMHMVMDLSHRFPVILDRLALISEPIYGPICRGQFMLSNWQIHTLTYQLKDRKPAIVYCRPPDSIILKFGAEPQMPGVIEHGPELLKAYDISMAQLKLGGFNVITYDWTTDSYEQLMGELGE